MKWLKLLFALLIFGDSTEAQTSIQLIVKSDKIEKIAVFDLSQTEFNDFKYNDTVVASFKKKNIDCYNIIYRAENKNFAKQIWLDTGHITIYGHIDTSELVLDTVINSPFYYLARDFYKKFSAYSREKDTARINELLLNGVRKNATNPFYLTIAFTYVNLNQNFPANLNILKNIIDSLPDKFEWFLLYPNVVSRIDKILSGVTVNTQKYVYTNVTGKQEKLLLQGADYYIMDFWFLNCKPCLEDHLEIKEKYTLLKSKRIELISISTDQDYPKWIKYLKDHQYNWPNYLQNTDLNIVKDLGISTFPTYIVLDKEGKVVTTVNSFSNIEAKFLTSK